MNWYQVVFKGATAIVLLAILRWLTRPFLPCLRSKPPPVLPLPQYGPWPLDRGAIPTNMSPAIRGNRKSFRAAVYNEWHPNRITVKDIYGGFGDKPKRKKQGVD